jgi:nucleotide-binding universal stress UspA family protein
MYKKVLVAVDLNVVLLRVNPPAPATAFGAAHMIAETYLAELAEEIESKGLRVTTRVRDGSPVEEILAAARGEAVDLIAMTTHGRSGASRLLFGSVAEGVLRDAWVSGASRRTTWPRWRPASRSSGSAAR